MSTVKKTTGSGTKALFSADGSAYIEFASVTKITPPSYSRGTVDVTDMNSFDNNNQFKEYLGDFIESDEIQIDGFYVENDAARAAVETAFFSGAECWIRIDLPVVIGKSMTVKGIVTKYQPMGDISPDSGIAFSVSLKPNAKPTLDTTPAG